jgi:hypothetical protein
MGLYDSIRFVGANAPESIKNRVFQTKSLENSIWDYEIDGQMRLILMHTYGDSPEKEGQWQSGFLGELLFYWDREEGIAWVVNGTIVQIFSRSAPDWKWNPIYPTPEWQPLQ